MRPHILSLFVTSLTIAAAQPAYAKLEVHEWGTFTSLVGSNGITQNGMYHEDEPLPGFVHPFGYAAGEQPLSPAPRPAPFPAPTRPCRGKMCMGDDFFKTRVVTQKMETPVIYFHADHAMAVDVNVRFPQGVVTETFPGPISTTPTVSNVGQLENGNTSFHVNVEPAVAPYLPYVEASNIYAHARNVDANLVTGPNGEREKFIFYRGIGRYQPRFSLSSLRGALTLTEPSSSAFTSLANYLVDVNEAGEARLMIIGRGTITATSIRFLRDHSTSASRTPIENASGEVLMGQRASEEIVHGLVRAGLNIDEAMAMVATWEHGYLKVPGLRLLSILPKAEIDQVLPLTVSPIPDRTERVFVSRIEVLLDTDEQAILNDIKQKRDAFDVSSLGRFAEPKLRRILQVADVEAAGGRPDALTRQAILRMIEKSSSLTEQPGHSSVQ